MHEEGGGGKEGRKEGAKPKPRQVSRRTQLKVGATRSGEGGTRDGTVLSSFFFFPLSLSSGGSTSITSKWHDPLAFHYRLDYTSAAGYCQAISLDPLDAPPQCIHDGFNTSLSLSLSLSPLSYVLARFKVEPTTSYFLRLTSIYLLLPPV